MTRLLFGALAGALLSATRTPTGLELVAAAGPTAGTVAAWWGIALGVIALAVALGPRLFDERPGLDLVAGATAGFALHALFLHERSVAQGAFALAAPALALIALARLAGGRNIGIEDTERPPRELRPLPVVSWTVLGLGAGVALVAVARHLTLLGAGRGSDEAVFGAVFALLALAGALSFGPALRKGRVDRARGRTAATALALAAASCVLSLSVLDGLRTERGFQSFLRGFGLDASLVGTAASDALIAAPVWVLPAFALGLALYCARKREQLVGLTVGLALAPLFVHWRLAARVALAIAPGGDASATDLLTAGDSAAGLVVEGCLLAGIAAGGILVSPPGPRWLRAFGLFFGAALAGGATQVPREPLTILSPWSMVPPRPRLVVEAPEGLVTVEERMHEGRVATLDRLGLSPPAARIGQDALCLGTSMHLVEPWPAGRGARLLVVGLLTPARVRALRSDPARPVERIDRTAAWHALGPALEAELFAEERELARRLPGSGTLPRDGEWFAPADARARILAGEYDLVVAPPQRGSTPVFAGDLDELGAHAVVVRWSDAATSLAHLRCDRVVALAGGVLELCVARVAGPAAFELPSEGDRRARVHASGVPLVELRANMDGEDLARRFATRRGRRAQLARAELAAALARDNAGGPFEALCVGLARHFAAQVPSSPYGTEAENIELDAAALDAWSEHALGAPPDLYTRILWGRLARVLTEKRAIQEVYARLAPLVERHGIAPWPELQATLALADLEALDPESAASRLEALLALTPNDAESWERLGRARIGLGQPVRAVEALRRCLELDPARRHALERDLAIALIQCGDPEGEELAREWLAEHPGDDGLRAMLKAGPQPLPGPTFRPDDDHDH